MRRIASVFTRRDKDRESSKADVKRAYSFVPAPLAPPLTPPLVPGLTSEHASSASSNGSVSLSLQTPDDNDPILTRTPTKSKSWTAWLGKKSGTIKRGRPADQHTPVDQLWVEPVPDWRPKQPAPILHAPPTPKSHPQSPPPVLDSDEEDASSSESDDDESVSLIPHSAPTLHPPITPTSVAQSRKNLEILIQNSLVPPFAPSSPFSHLVGAPMYPRSSNPPHSLPARQSMQTTMHKSVLLRRLQHPDVLTLSVVQQLDRSILTFASRLPPTPVDSPSPLPWFNDRALPAAMRLSPSSRGLRRWMARPCFEERIAVWVSLNGVVTQQPVTGSSCAVAELEYSVTLDAMIGFGFPPAEEENSPPSPVAVAPVPTPQQPQPQPAVAAVVRSVPYQAVPSPLRNSTLKSPPSKSPVSEIPPSSATSPDSPAPPTPPAAAPAPTASRVRDARKRQSSCAKSKRGERMRRKGAKQEEERLRREQERRQWEEEKRTWEKEKKAMEEERKRRIYAEEVAAARVRREQQRAGGGYGASDTGHLAASSSTTSLRDERNKQETGRYTRPLHDQQGPRRQASESAVPQLANTPSSSPHTSSPGSSRPPSVGGHGSLRGNSSRPPSVHTTSSEDVRQPSSSHAGKRGSMASLPGKMPNNQFDWSSYSTGSASNPALMVPPVPPVPMYAMDMPLLPPTPPFMLQQYPRPRSQNSQNSASPSPSSPSGSQSRQRLPSNGSSERVNLVQQQQYGSSSGSRRGSNASSSSSHRPVMPSHQRRSSDDARRVSLPPPKDDRGRSQPSSLRSQSSTSLPRGRPPMPSSYQQPPVPSPWSAPPLATSYSQQQLSPAAIINGYGQRVPPKASRRQTTIS
ncbi:hypothetical protein MVEN_01237400 [Mycena venus]|uniref:Uncharacterized protein n=1 Tax=Mycena venus TaxID=2733690 RepID=A0A8H6Y279_9AGAR|nr:hypothetical protein MVEN_01237400 [Mycena venus]